MEYSLAKELKDMGFPQRTKFYYVSRQFENYRDGNVIEVEPYLRYGHGGWVSDVCTAAPTLSELIEVCGEDFGGLEQYSEAPADEHWEAMSARIWILEPKAKNPQFDHVVYGSTPTEAVARLWLALNKHGDT